MVFAKRSLSPEQSQSREQSRLFFGCEMPSDGTPRRLSKVLSLLLFMFPAEILHLVKSGAFAAEKLLSQSEEQRIFCVLRVERTET